MRSSGDMCLRDDIDAIVSSGAESGTTARFTCTVGTLSWEASDQLDLAPLSLCQEKELFFYFTLLATSIQPRCRDNIPYWNGWQRQLLKDRCRIGDLQ